MMRANVLHFAEQRGHRFGFGGLKAFDDFGQVVERSDQFTARDEQPAVVAIIAHDHAQAAADDGGQTYVADDVLRNTRHFSHVVGAIDYRHLLSLSALRRGRVLAPSYGELRSRRVQQATLSFPQPTAAKGYSLPVSCAFLVHVNEQVGKDTLPRSTRSRTAAADDLRQPAQSYMMTCPDLGSSSAPFVREF